MQEIERNENLSLALVGFIDDDIRKQSKRFLGYPVFGGKDHLNEIVDRYQISEVIISFQNMDRAAMSSLKKECSALGVNLSHLSVIID
jgi:FlaA1/EpsC-like NDP-sugar epimerase